MANDYFRFKQFTVHQDRCAMKVSTDACLFGAWTPFPDSVQTVLDIGTGTGLLSLMVAQRYGQVQITALERDAAAALQAAENFDTSPFKDRLKVLEADVLDYRPIAVYDAIICNPPFFIGSLKGPDAKRNDARHENALPFEALLRVAKTLLADTGLFYVLLPTISFERFHLWAGQNGFYLTRQVLVRPNAVKPANRIMAAFQLHPGGRCLSEELTIYQAPNHYTPETIELLRPFYLFL